MIHNAESLTHEAEHGVCAIMQERVSAHMRRLIHPQATQTRTMKVDIAQAIASAEAKRMTKYMRDKYGINVEYEVIVI